MPKSFLRVIFALAVVTIPLFFIVLFLSTAQRKKRLRGVVQAELESLAGQLRQRCELLLETLKSTRTAGTSVGQLLFDAAEEELECLRCLSPSAEAISHLVALDARLENQFRPWLEALPDSYAKRKLAPIQPRVEQARASYNDAARLLGGGLYPLFKAAETE